MNTRIKEPYPWVGHIPFAFYLVEKLKPSIIVELGTHSGNSFCAFCQASKDYSPFTKVYAIDTWEGDEHSGKYDESVFENLTSYVDHNFTNIGFMIRKDFNDAVNDFSDNSIDILHIDGFHTYEAVRNDFETWLPKLKEDSIVLFHDTMVFSNGFGVHQYWCEIREKYLFNFNFSHSNGLGILAIEKNNNTRSTEFIDFLNRPNFMVNIIKGYGELLEKYYETNQKLVIVEKKIENILSSKTYKAGLFLKKIQRFFK
jgi:hypothetical protein